MGKLMNYQRRQRVTETVLEHYFEWADTPGAGFTFNLNDEGKAYFIDRINCEVDEDGEPIWHTGEEIMWVYGEPKPEGWPETHYGVINYLNCIEGKYTGLIDHGIIERQYTGIIEAHGECEDCGREVWLYNDYGHGVDCECGAIYSGLGNRLAPRSQWEDRYSEESTQPYCVEFGYNRGDY